MNVEQPVPVGVNLGGHLSYAELDVSGVGNFSVDLKAQIERIKVLRPNLSRPHKRGFSSFSWGSFSGVRRTTCISPGPSRTVCTNSILSIFPFSVPWTVWSAEFWSSTLTVKSACRRRAD